MSRCQLWRYRPDGGGDKYALPGTDRKTWAPCREPVAGSGEAGCQGCYRALLTCLNHRVRLALARDLRTPTWVLEALSADGDEAVAQAARLRTGAPILPVVELDDLAQDAPWSETTDSLDDATPGPDPAAEPVGEPGAAPLPLPLPFPTVTKEDDEDE